MLKGIDVSKHNGVINWDVVKPQIDYAILSIGYGSDFMNQDDPQFKRNANECTRLGIPFGVYIYSYATLIEQAKSEAKHVLRQIKGYKLSYPVYLDLEDADTTGMCSNLLIADMSEAFCNIIESAGYLAGIYANTSWFNTRLTDSRFDRWVKWVAQYASRCYYEGEYGMWQYCSDGRVLGIDGNGGDVDMNYCYVDYPSKINKKEDVHFKIDLYSHVQDMDDMKESGIDFCEIGTTGKGLEEEALSINIEGTKGEKVVIKYGVHMEDVGDVESTIEGQILGSRGQHKELEGLWIKTLEIPEGYKIQYQVHLKDKGWSDWIDSPNFAGSRGEHRRMEAFRVKVVRC